MTDPTPQPWIDPVIEVYKRDVDRTLLRENLKLAPAERLTALKKIALAVEELRRGMREATARR